VKPFHHDLSSLVRFSLDDAALASLAWKDFGNGSAMAKLAREGETGLVLYKIAAGAQHDVFQPHTHPGGEVYLVLRGAIVDESGTYPAGSMVWMNRGSKHTPRGTPEGDTVVLVLWPAGGPATTGSNLEGVE
jgi:anti-sigma factor ChrR (cupin superfamily)